MTDQEERIIEVARDLVALWQNPKIRALPRSERNAAIDETRERLIEAVESLKMVDVAQKRLPKLK